MSDTSSVCEERIFSNIFQEYSDNLFHYLYYKTGDEALSQDLSQEAFTRLWKNCAKVALQTAKGYVFKIANNLLLNNYEHKKVVLKFQQRKPLSHTSESPEFVMEENELKTQLETAISNLPEKQRVVFLMSHIDKMTYKEIAATLGISRQAVEKRMYNALDKLRVITDKIR
ncbi:MAG: sigma-70 family RNA polymerase sigma factor [Bacteroidota bacterium]